jgi:hypothetical protein
MEMKLSRMAQFKRNEAADTNRTLLEIATTSYRIIGTPNSPSALSRLSDFLNLPVSTLTLENASVRSTVDFRAAELESIVVDKAKILVAVPHEPAETLAARRLQRFGIAPPAMVDVSATVYIPPFQLRGVLKLQSPKDLAIWPEKLRSFFAMSEVEVTGPDGFAQLLPVLLVNRMHVLAMGGSPVLGQ